MFFLALTAAKASVVDVPRVVAGVVAAAVVVGAGAAVVATVVAGIKTEFLKYKKIYYTRRT